MSVRVLVCGDRRWAVRWSKDNVWSRLAHQDDIDLLKKTLDAFDEVRVIDTVIEGEALGADTWGRYWAEDNGKDIERYPAQWETHNSYGRSCWCKDKTAARCRGAGPIRNIEMLEHGRPDLVVAFHRNLSESRGTKHMVTISRRAGVPTFVVPDDAVR